MMFNIFLEPAISDFLIVEMFLQVQKFHSNGIHRILGSTRTEHFHASVQL